MASTITTHNEDDGFVFVRMKQQHDVVRELANLKSQSMVSRIETEFRAALEALIEERVAQYFGGRGVEEPIMEEEEEDRISISSSITIEEAIEAVNQIFEEVRQQQHNVASASPATTSSGTASGVSSSPRTRAPSVVDVPTAAPSDLNPQRTSAEFQQMVQEAEDRRLARLQAERRAELSGLSQQAVVSSVDRRSLFIRPHQDRQTVGPAAPVATAASSEISALRSRGVVSSLGAAFRGQLEGVLRSGTMVHRTQGELQAAIRRRVVQEGVAAEAVPEPRPNWQPPRQRSEAQQQQLDLGRFSFPSEIIQGELESVETFGVVTDLLRSDFATRLERLLRDRAQGPPPRVQRAAALATPQQAETAAFLTAAQPSQGPAPSPRQARGPVRYTRERLQQISGSGTVSARALGDLSATIKAMKEEMNEMRSMVGTCLEMQMELQRAVRQELAGCLRIAAESAPTETIACQERTSQAAPARGDNCMICVEKHCDAVFYRCGHMCVCFGCAKEMQQRNLSCPVCRAAIVDVVRAYKA